MADVEHCSGIGCVQTCCVPKQGKPELTEPSCTYAKGVYENVNVEIDEHCRVIRITKADNRLVRLCDPCD